MKAKLLKIFKEKEALIKYAKSINNNGYLDGIILHLEMKKRDAERNFLDVSTLDFINSPISK